MKLTLNVIESGSFSFAAMLSKRNGIIALHSEGMEEMWHLSGVESSNADSIGCHLQQLCHNRDWNRLG